MFCDRADVCPRTCARCRSRLRTYRGPGDGPDSYYTVRADERLVAMFGEAEFAAMDDWRESLPAGHPARRLDPVPWLEWLASRRGRL